MNDPIVSIATPAQRGVQYVSGKCPSFDVGSFVPNGESASLKESANVIKTPDEEAEISNIGTGGHHVIVSGEFSIKAGVEVPNVGQEITSDETAARKFVITTDVEVTGWSNGGKPLIIKFDAEFHPKVDAVDVA